MADETYNVQVRLSENRVGVELRAAYVDPALCRSTVGKYRGELESRLLGSYGRIVEDFKASTLYSKLCSVRRQLADLGSRLGTLAADKAAAEEALREAVTEGKDPSSHRRKRDELAGELAGSEKWRAEVGALLVDLEKQATVELKDRLARAHSSVYQAASIASGQKVQVLLDAIAGHLAGVEVERALMLFGVEDVYRRFAHLPQEAPPAPEARPPQKARKNDGTVTLGKHVVDEAEAAAQALHMRR